MRPIHSLLVVSLVLLPILLPAAAFAQEKYDIAPLPAVCKKAGMSAAAGSNEMKAEMPAGGMAMPSDDAHKALAAGMAKMQADMAAGIQVPDIDIAFNCSMIPHHQGAISMARVELAYGKDPENRKLAEAIIKAQEAEVMRMLAWLDQHSK
jgi:uncharacterized protein (DUF305 family)